MLHRKKTIKLFILICDFKPFFSFLIFVQLLQKESKRVFKRLLLHENAFKIHNNVWCKLRDQETNLLRDLLIKLLEDFQR